MFLRGKAWRAPATSSELVRHLPSAVRFGAVSSSDRSAEVAALGVVARLVRVCCSWRPSCAVSVLADFVFALEADTSRRRLHGAPRFGLGVVRYERLERFDAGAS
jgi:hypothetical protein